MAATTITRASITDDDGSGTTGTILNAAWVGSAIYDKVDTLFTSSWINENSTNGERSFRFVNTSTGNAAYAYVSAGNDQGTYGPYHTRIQAYGTAHSTYPDTGELSVSGAGGLTLRADHASGAVKFMTGGANVRGGVLSIGHFWVQELAANPTTSDITADNQLAFYQKSDKLVFAYNNGGTMTYITLDLDGSDTTWAHSTSAP